MQEIRSQTHRRQGFSLVELSIVMAIVSVVVILGLESTSIFMNRTAYSVTKERQAIIKEALAKHRFVYGYLPCPAPRNTAPTNSQYGKEIRSSGECYTPRMDGVHFGDIPVRDLNLPLSFMRDGYGSKMSYLVSMDLTRPGTSSGSFSHPSSEGLITIRTGKIEQPCSSMCQTIASAAYLVLSVGADKRGAGSNSCPITTATDGMIDTVNCRFGSSASVRVNGSGAAVTPADGVFYDSRYNNGTVEEMHFDDILVWQTKRQL
jgi:prepilin-type N-terminal cleavage/methylation domain-containing protein